MGNNKNIEERIGKGDKRDQVKGNNNNGDDNEEEKRTGNK